LGRNRPSSRAARRPYSVLLPVGFTVPPSVAGDAVRSYRTLSISPARRLSLKDWATCFLLHCPLDHSSRPLAGTVISWSPDFPRRESTPPRRGRPALWHGGLYRHSMPQSSPIGLGSNKASRI